MYFVKFYFPVVDILFVLPSKNDSLRLKIRVIEIIISFEDLFYFWKMISFDLLVNTCKMNADCLFITIKISK